MKYVLRLWTCIGCGKSNKTEIAKDGTVRCDACSDVARIPFTRKRAGGEAGSPTGTRPCAP